MLHVESRATPAHSLFFRMQPRREICDIHTFPVSPMPEYLIERNIPGAGKLSPSELRAISQKSCDVLNRMGPQIQWVQSYVTDDQINCIYRAPNEEMIREHARQGGFPADRISQIRTVIDPTTAE